MRNRQRRVEVYLSDDEFNSLTENVGKTGLSRESYLRFLINNITPKERPPMQLFDVLKELRQINVNMNQIAMKANTLNLVDAPFYRSCHEKLQESVGKIMEAVY